MSTVGDNTWETKIPQFNNGQYRHVRFFLFSISVDLKVSVTRTVLLWLKVINYVFVGLCYFPFFYQWKVKPRVASKSADCFQQQTVLKASQKDIPSALLPWLTHCWTSQIFLLCCFNMPFLCLNTVPCLHISSMRSRRNNVWIREGKSSIHITAKTLLSWNRKMKFLGVQCTQV